VSATLGVAQQFEDYDQHDGDRERMFRAVADRWPGLTSVLYPGSYIDVSPSFVFADVTYVDVDRRAAAFFMDRPAVEALTATRRDAEAEPARWRFLQADFLEPLDVSDGAFDLLVSLYAGFVSPACARYLRRGGLLLVNNSHGDASMASLDPAFRLVAVMTRRDGRYRIIEDGLADFLTPRKPGVEVDAMELRRTNRGVRYRKDAAAYLFERVESR
jgi:hypothetical protein